MIGMYKNVYLRPGVYFLLLTKLDMKLLTRGNWDSLLEQLTIRATKCNHSLHLLFFMFCCFAWYQSILSNRLNTIHWLALLSSLDQTKWTVTSRENLYWLVKFERSTSIISPDKTYEEYIRGKAAMGYQNSGKLWLESKHLGLLCNHSSSLNWGRAIFSTFFTSAKGWRMVELQPKVLLFQSWLTWFCYSVAIIPLMHCSYVLSEYRMLEWSKYLAS